MKSVIGGATTVQGASKRKRSPNVGPTTLLILQAIERCNLNCTYCYLPNRTKSGRMSVETVAGAARWLREEGLLGQHLEVLWHAGEPLLAGLTFYEDAHEALGREIPAGVQWTHGFQTNATLISDDWAAFFKRVGARVGVSIDGPQEWHDARRRTWSNKGSFAQVVRGIEVLKRHSIPFSTISVLSLQSIQRPSELYAFLRGLGASSIGFNDEEKEGINASTIASGANPTRAHAEAFYQAMYDLAAADHWYSQVREIGRTLKAIRHLSRVRLPVKRRPRIPSEMSDPFRMLNVAFDGRFATFSPELLGQNLGEMGEFVLGDVHTSSLKDVLKSDKFRKVSGDIAAGIEACRTTCEYYEVCGGGCPSNKHSENGSFASTRTTFCELAIIAPTNAVLQRLEAEQTTG